MKRVLMIPHLSHITIYNMPLCWLVHQHITIAMTSTWRL